MRFVAGRDAVAELLARGNVAKSHREDVAGQGADAEVFLAGSAVAELLLAGVPWKSLPLGERRCGGIVEELAAGRGRCSCTRKVQSSTGKVQSSIGKRLNGSNQHFTPFLFQCHRPHSAIPIIIKYKRAA